MPLPTAITDTWSGLLDLLYPPKCLLCFDMNAGVLCPRCRSGFADLIPPVCERCGLEVGSKHSLCPKCEAGEVMYFAEARAAGRFEGALRHAILRLKYGEKRRLAEPLGEYLASFLQTGPFSATRIDVVVPVPLHPSRLRERGFNQSALLAEPVAIALGVRVNETALRRTRRTRPQAELRASERAANIRNAFAVDDVEVVRGRTVLLIDDVLTTCHTANEIARVLLNAGARAVYVGAVARG